jgi:F0F1-type ATP synthase assembly protein I
MDIQAKALQIVTAQAAVAAVVAVVLAALSGWAAGGSALAGGLIAAAGSLYFARWLAAAGNRPPRDFARAFMIGEGLKIAFTALAFWVAIVPFGARPAPLVSAYAITLIVYWLALLPGMPGAATQRR